MWRHHLDEQPLAIPAVNGVPAHEIEGSWPVELYSAVAVVEG